MGAFNIVEGGAWGCQFCGHHLRRDVQFKYGFLRQLKYKVGDVIAFDPGLRGNIGTPGQANVVTLGCAEDNCPACGSELDYEVWLDHDRIVAVIPLTGNYDFLEAEEGYFIVENRPPDLSERSIEPAMKRRAFLKETIKSLEAEYDPETGFLGLLRDGVFDLEACQRFEALLKSIRFDNDRLLDRRLVALTWSVPLFMTWQRERIQENGGSVSELDEAISRIEPVLHALLGTP